MKSHIKRIMSILLCSLLLLSLPGCWNRRELNTLAIVLGIGVDRAEKPNKIQLTAQLVNPSNLKSSTSDEKNTDAKAYLNMKNSGETTFETVRGFTHESNRKLYFPHIQEVIFGREMAEQGIKEQVDFFIRDHETRFSILIFVSDTTAHQVFETPPEIEKIPAMHISKLIQAQKANSQTPIVTLEDFVARLMSKTTAPIAPMVKILEEKEKKTLLIEGTAVFKGDKLIGELDKTETRGLLWITDEIKSGIMDVPSPENDGKVSLEILHAKSKVTPMLREDKVVIQVDVQEEGTLATQSSPATLTPETLAALEQSQAEAIQKEMLAALRQARKLNADVFGFGDKVYQKFPKEWEKLETEWEDIFPELEVELNITATIRRTGRISNLPIPIKE